MAQSPIFELIDETSSGIAPALLGLWTTRPRPSPEEPVSFEPTQSGSEDLSTVEPVWRVNLPGNLDIATAHLAQGKHALSQSQQAIHKAPEQIVGLIRSKIPAASQSFSTLSDVNDSQQKLLAVLSLLQQEESGVSFGLGEQLSETWQQTTQQFQAFSDRLMRSFTQSCRIETCVENSCLGRSHVGWTGDISTTWRRDVSQEHMKLHQEALALALASRDSVLQHFALAVRVAVQLAALVASPGSAVFLLPMAWKYLQKILHSENSAFFH